MPRSRTLAVVLAWLLTGPVIAAPQKTVEKVMTFPDGCVVEVALGNGETLRGRIGEPTYLCPQFPSVNIRRNSEVCAHCPGDILSL